MRFLDFFSPSQLLHSKIHVLYIFLDQNLFRVKLKFNFFFSTFVPTKFIYSTNGGTFTYFEHFSLTIGGYI